MDTRRLAVIGAGTMGRGIIESAIARGVIVDAFDPSESARQAASTGIALAITKSIARGKLEASCPEEVLDRLTWHSELTATATNADFVIEAVPEDEALKRNVFVQLDAACRPGVILASNTSSVSITRLGDATGRPALVVGMHFFNPVPVMPPVEVVRGARTSDETIEETHRLAERLGKQPLDVADRPGFVVNRVLMPMINEAVFALHEQVADAATIDELMTLGCNHPMGPLALADLIGLDVCLSILQVLERDLDDSKFRPCPLLEQKVQDGFLGRKSGHGFYDYEKS